MEMGGNFCQILELGGTTIKWRVDTYFLSENFELSPSSTKIPYLL